jgi:hypothetical protein
MDGRLGDPVADTSNWEFAAVVAAVVMGLGGLLLFTLISVIGAWRIFGLADRAAKEAMAAVLGVQELARDLVTRENRAQSAVDIRQTASDITDLRRQADALIEQQSRLQDAVRNLVEAGVLGGDESTRQLQELEAAIRRLEDNMSQVAAAVANLGSRMN